MESGPSKKQCSICGDELQTYCLPDYFQCQRCGLIAADKVESLPEVLYPQGYYGSNGVKFIGLFEAIRGVFLYERVHAVAKSYPGKARSVLDIGCGNGKFLKAMSLCGFEIYGVELPGAAFEAAKVTPGIHLVPSRIVTPSLFAEDSFSAITFWHVLEHLENPDDMLKACGRWIKKDGHLFIEVPFIESWQARLFGKHWLHLDAPRHRFFFTRRSMRCLLKQAGFSIKEKATFSFEMGVFGVIQSTLNLFFAPSNYFYDEVMRRKEKTHCSVKYLISFFFALLLFPGALLFALLEAVFYRGAVLRYVCVKNDFSRGS